MNFRDKTLFFQQNKFLPPQNTLIIPSKSAERKYELLETQASSNILPPHINSNVLDPTSLPASEEFPQIDKTNERRNADSEEVNVQPRQPPPTGFVPPKLLPTYNQEFRKNEEGRLRQLGVPVQNQAQSLPAQTQSTSKPVVRTFDPDKNYKAFEHIFQPGKKATHKGDQEIFIKRPSI